MSIKERLRIGTRIRVRKIKELVRFDSKPLSLILTGLYLLYYFYIRVSRGRREAMLVVGKIFRHTQFPGVRKIATGWLLKQCRRHGLVNIGEDFLFMAGRYVAGEFISDLARTISAGDDRPFHKRLLILSAPTENEKGVMIIKFTDYFKYFLMVFDMTKICRDYIVIFEPSYSGYFDEDILCLLSAPGPFIIEASEKEDYQFIESLKSPIYPVETGANWWVDDSAFAYPGKLPKPYDITMVAIWADFKRHYHLFEAMSRAQVKRRVALVGKPWEMTREDIEAEARYYGVLEHVDFYEGISQKDINMLLARSKCLILLSKKEGFNKSIVEAMYAGIPVFILEGHNYGEKYSYINKETGGYIDKKGLAKFLDNLDEILTGFERVKPGEWIRSNISSPISTEMILETIRRIETKHALKINPRLEIKVNSPEFDYYDPKAWDRMRDSYRSLEKYLR